MANDALGENQLEENALRAENAILKALLTSSLTRMIDADKIGRVFHDFNNILSSSMGYASLAQGRSKHLDDEKLTRYLENIERAGLRARDLVRESLESRRLQRDAHVTSLRDVVSAIFGNIQHSLPAHDLLHISRTHLNVIFDLLGGLYDVSALALDGELVEEAHCEACSSELRGMQMRLHGRVEKNIPRSATIESREVDIALLQALVNSNGGHMCDTLVQDLEFVVYLRAVTARTT